MTTTTHEPTTPTTQKLDPETRRVLATAKGLIAAGWCQNYAFDGTGYCIAGALCAAVGGTPEEGIGFMEDGDEAAYVGARSVIEHFLAGFIPEWNDAPGRTQADVVALFDKALAG